MTVSVKESGWGEGGGRRDEEEGQRQSSDEMSHANKYVSLHAMLYLLILKKK